MAWMTRTLVIRITSFPRHPVLRMPGIGRQASTRRRTAGGKDKR